MIQVQMVGNQVIIPHDKAILVLMRYQSIEALKRGNVYRRQQVMPAR